MIPPDPAPSPAAAAAVAVAPKAKWWGKYVTDNDPTRYQLVILWRRIIFVAVSLCLVGYLALATALWGYYSIVRKVPEVNWIDIAVLPRFSRVQAAIGAKYFTDAKQYWANRDYVRGIFNARAAVLKVPQNLDARLFLADCWLQAGRANEAIRTLREGIEFDAANPRLQQALVETMLSTAHFGELLKLLREDLPARGVRLLDGKDRIYQLAEVRAALDTSDAAEAERVFAAHKGLSDLPAATPLLARIDWELGRQDAAFSRLQAARDADPTDPVIQDSYVDTALRMGNVEEARAASKVFLRAFPNLISAQLRFLEAHGARQGEDRTLWTDECVRFLVQFRHQPLALARLGTLAASQGWTDLAFLLYENSLHDNLTGFPFALYYVGSLVKAGNFAAADTIWHELSTRNLAQMGSSAYFGAMVAWGSGRESEALQIIDQLRRETANDPSHRRSIVQVFRDFGFPKIADELANPQS
jgi:tetratricopeptide (TPR) repeat protein